jgi:hypothetical protein
MAPAAVVRIPLAHHETPRPRRSRHEPKEPHDHLQSQPWPRHLSLDGRPACSTELIRRGSTRVAAGARDPPTSGDPGPPGIAAWTALPERDRSLLLWLVHGDVVTAELAALLVSVHRRIAQRRLARLVEYGLLSGFWAANRQRPRGRYA